MSLAANDKNLPLGDKLGAQPRSRTALAKPRLYYSPDNAQVFRPTFDRMIAERKDLEILSSATGWKSSTLYARAQDALKWLVDFDANKEKYLLLRSQISISKQYSPEGIALYFKPSMTKIITEACGTKEEHASWKDSLTRWLSTAQSGDMWDSVQFYPEGITITPEDIKWLTETLAALEGCEMDVGNRKVKVMR